MAPRKIQFVAIFIAIFISFVQTRPPQKILNGEIVPITERPYQASLQKPNGHHFCGGAIIASKFILTAAHCLVDIETVDMKSSIGDIDVLTGTNNKLKRGPHNVFRVSRRVVHAKYNYSISSVNDIAVLKLDESIPFNEVQSKISLPSQDAPVHAKVITSGWGAIMVNSSTQELTEVPRYLRKMKSIVLEQNDCQKRMNSTIHPQYLCTDSMNHTSPCRGDSGGPVTYLDELVGIVSWGKGCGRGNPEVATRVYMYKSWIQKVLDALTDDADFISTPEIREILPVYPSVVGV